MRVRQIGTLVGSPPRAWGQLVVADRVITLGRFTPTGVGTMCAAAAPASSAAVHPHGRGDNFVYSHQ